MTTKAIFLDLDGTYADSHGIVPDSARDAVVAARANGHRALLCTGRALALLNENVLAAGFDGLITSAGGYVEIDGQTLLHRSLPVDVLEEVIAFLGERGIDFYMEGNNGIFSTPAGRDRVRELVFAGVTDPKVIAQLQKGIGWLIDMCVVDQDLRRTDINSLNILASDTPVSVYQDQFGDRLSVRNGSVRVFGPNNAELTPFGLSKVTAIKLVCDHLGVPWEDTLAYGDGANDLEMIQYVHTGVAMGNAIDEVKAAATVLTGTPEEGGIAASFAKLGLI